MIHVRPLREDERGWVHSTIRERWGSDIVVAHGDVYEPAGLPGFVAEDEDRLIGLLTYVLEGDTCEIVTIDAFEEGRGVGAALIGCGQGNRRAPALAGHDERQRSRAAVLRAAGLHARCGPRGRGRPLPFGEA